MPEEYRVVWRREGYGKRSKIFQTRPPAERFCEVLKGNPPLPSALRDRDPDDYACCSGFECGCHGTTVAQAIEAEVARRRDRYAAVPPLTFGPAIERRDVGEWADGALAIPKELAA